MNRSRLVGLLARALFAVMLLMPAVVPAAAPAGAQSLTTAVIFTPSQVAQTGSVTVTGIGFGCGSVEFANTATVFLLDSTGQTTVATLGTTAAFCGTFTQDFVIPNTVAPGQYRIQAIDSFERSATSAGLLTVVTGVTITGIAQCSNGKGGFTPLPFITVQLFSGSVLVGTTRSNADAGFSFPGAAVGATYQLRFLNDNVDGPAIFLCATTVSTGDGVIIAPPPVCFDQSWDTAGVLQSGVQDSDLICKAGQSIWRKVSVQPGQQVSVVLGNAGSHTRIAVFKDLRKDLQTLLATPTPVDARQLDASMNGVAGSPWESSPWESSPWESSPWESSPWESSPWESSPWESSPWESSPFDPTQLCQALGFAGSTDACAGAYMTVQIRDLLAFSKNGQVTRNTFDLAGDFYIRIYNDDASFDPTTRLTILGSVVGTCGVPPQSGLAPVLKKTNSSFFVSPTQTQGIAAGARTLIITNTSRLIAPNGRPLTDPSNATLLGNFRTTVNNFAGQPSVGGAVVDLATDGGLALDYQQWDTPPFPSCPAAANIVSGAIHDVINAYRSQPGSVLQYVTILGGHTVVPYHITPDHAELEAENGYNPGLTDISKSAATLGDAYVMTDSYYVSLSPISRLESEISLPDANMAVGRIVEFPSDIQAVLQDFIDNGGLARPTTGLVTGYTFFTDLANFEKSQLTSAGIATDSLISDTWTAPDLRNKLFTTPAPGIMAINWHARSNEAVAADYATQHPTTISSAEIANLPATDTRFRNTLVISIGCHLAYPLLNADVIANPTTPPQFVTEPRAFTETLQNRGAMVLGNSGFGYGDTDFVGYSEELIALVTQELTDAAPNPVPMGIALTNAKRRYLQNSGATTGVDKKAVEELTFYGPPMWSVGLPNRVARPGSNSLVVNPQAADGAPGLSANNAAPPYTLTSHQIGGDGEFGGTTYFSADHDPADLSGGTQEMPYRATLPFKAFDVSAPGAGVARGVALISATYTDLANTTSTVDVPATEVTGARPPWPAQGFWPSQTFGLNELTGQELVTTPIQWQSSDGLLGTTRRYADSSTNLRVYYSNDTSAAALAGPASISDVELSANNATSLHVDLTVKASTVTGVFDVLVNYTVPPTPGNPGQWVSCSLVAGRLDGATTTRSCNGAFSFTTSFVPGSVVRHYVGDIDTSAFAGASAGDLRLGFQAVTGTGLVSMRNNDGQYFRLVQDATTIGNPKAVTFISINPLPTPITYGLPATFSAILTSTRSTCSAVGQPLTFNLGSQTKTALTDNAGMAKLSFVVQEVPANYTLTVTFPETTSCLGTSAFNTPATILKNATTLTFGNTPYVAILRDATNTPMRERFLYFNFQGTSNGGVAVNATRSAETDANGIAQLRGMTVPAGTYTVTVTFPGTIPTSTGTIKLNDPFYLASTAQTRVTADRTAPSCVLSSVNYDSSGIATSINVVVQDSGSGLSSVNPTSLVNGTFAAPSYTAGTTAPVTVTVFKTDLTQSTQVTLQVLDVAGNVTNCDPVMVSVGRGDSKVPRTFTATVSGAESRATIYNAIAGVQQVQIKVNNGKVIEVLDLEPGETRTLDLASVMQSGNNKVTVSAQGKPGGSATVLFTNPPDSTTP